MMVEVHVDKLNLLNMDKYLVKAQQAKRLNAEAVAAEINAEALKTGDVADVTLTVEIGDEEDDWIAVNPAGDAWPDVDGWWIPRAMIHRATDPLTARADPVTDAEGGQS